jgi:hypothetical protein
MTSGVHVDFHGWNRSGVFGVVPNPSLTDGRLTGSVGLTLSNDQPPSESVTETVTFDILGPGDVQGLKPGAVTRAVPTAGALDAEETKCAYVELGAPDLPWRYTPELAVGLGLRPWIVLVTARPDQGEITLNAGGTVTLTGAALATHDLLESQRWAHLQDDEDDPSAPRVARLLSPRDLEPATTYVAVVVASFTADGQPAWTAGTPNVTLPTNYWWQFTTGPAGDFPSLAAKLVPGTAPSDLGVAPMSYSPVPDSGDLRVRGALAPIDSTDDIIPAEVSADVGVLTQPVVDPLRPVIGLANYGDAWVADPTLAAWVDAFHSDPRARAVAGLGLRAGIEQQELLVDAAAAQAGAIASAAQRIRHLTAGLAVARSLWSRRLPADPVRRLAVFGPSLRGIPTASGSVRDRVTAPGRPLPPAIFSTAARRILRNGPARTGAVATGAADPAAVLVQANTPPPPAPRAPSGLPHADLLAKATHTAPLDTALTAGTKAGNVPAAHLAELYTTFDRKGYAPATLKQLDAAVTHALTQAKTGATVNVMALVSVLDAPLARRPTDSALLGAVGRVTTEPDGPSLLALARQIATAAPARASNPVDLTALADAVDGAVDPGQELPFMVSRVLATIGGIGDAQPLAPPELSPDLDLPAWTFLRDEAPDWLLPGAAGLTEHHVVAVQSNQAFVDAFLLGINTQTIGELRFRNIPIRSKATPLRQFWSRVDPAADGYLDDILDIDGWAADSLLGDPAHRPGAGSSTDLVLVFRSPLFRRYPRTVVYLAPVVVAGGVPDWQTDPDIATRLLPSFQGVVAPDLTFFGFDLDPALAASHWVVLEEPPHAVQFFNSPVQADGTPVPGFDAARTAAFQGATDGATFAKAAFADPFRVLIRGDVLMPGTPS